MLSRVAERTYWIGRNSERVENTARLINVNAQLLLDLPRMVGHVWEDTIDITGLREQFQARFSRADERNVVRFMLADRTNSGSLICSVSNVRENARTTREIIPSEAWELINELYLYVRKHVEASLKRDGRHRFLSDVITYCHELTGALSGTMSHGPAYDFVRAGRNLERADMTTRIVDVGCLTLFQEHDTIPDSYDNTLWMNVLRSLSAYQMYRQHVPDRVNGEDVVGFLLKDTAFPRSVAHCLRELANCFERLPQNDQPARSVTHTQRMVNEADISKLLVEGLHEFIDEIQIDLAALHGSISRTWFGHDTE